MNIESLAEWSEAKLENGLYVRRAVGRCPLFWAEWRANKSALKAEGIAVRPVAGQWEVTYATAEAPAVSLSVPSFVPPALPEGVVLSAEQQAIVDWFVNGQGNLVVRARAGTGKTFTIVYAISRAPERRKAYFVFGKENQLEAEQKISDPNVDVLTLHSLGLRFINSVWSGSKFDKDGGVEMDRVIAAAPRNTPVEVLAAVNKLVAFAKNCFANVPSLAQMMDLADARGIQIESEDFSDRAISEIAIRAMQNAMVRDAQRRVSGNDMVWLPVAMGWVRPCYDFAVVDEAQDMNLPQLLMAIGAVFNDGRLAVVGDDRQAIFAFRGAAQNGIDMMKEKLNAAEIGLTITRRCPQVVVEHVQQWVPDYKSAVGSPKGELLNIGDGLLSESVQIGDAILSRKNAPLMPICLGLLRKGVPARIRGRDVGAQLAAIARKFKAKSVPHLIEKIQSWQKRQLQRCGTGPHAEAKMEVIEDQAACLIALAEGCVNVEEIFVRIADIFVDKEGFQRPCVTLSSVHKFKGLEANNVYLLAKTFRPERGGEEENLAYVGATRAKKKLIYVHAANSENPENN
jgi:DNA helicase-2/ATP-dependent DNA helicase PcrA